MIKEEREMRLNWKKLGSAAILFGALLLMSIVGFSQQGGPQGGPPPGGFRGGPGPHDGLGPLRDLNLTDDQKAAIKKLTDSFEESALSCIPLAAHHVAIKKLTDSFEESIKPLLDQMKTLHESEPNPMSGAAFDEAAVRAAAEARAKVQVELEVAHARLASQIFALLTAEQKAQLAAKHQQFGQRHPGGPPPPPPGAPNK
jgi:Spy/CpxP family protein refolding chaperone